MFESLTSLHNCVVKAREKREHLSNSIFIKFPRTFKSTQIFSCTRNFKDFVAGEYKTQKAFNEKPEAELETMEPEKLEIDQQSSSPNHSEIDVFPSEQCKLSSMLSHDQDPYLCPTTNSNSYPSSVNSTCTIENCDNEPVLENSPSETWTDNNDLTLEDIDSFLQDTLQFPVVRSYDLEKLVGDCTDLDFQKILSTEPELDESPTKVETRVIEISPKGSEISIPTMTIEFDCPSNCKIKHQAKVDFICKPKKDLFQEEKVTRCCCTLSNGRKTCRFEKPETQKKQMSKRKTNYSRKSSNKKKPANKKSAKRGVKNNYSELLKRFGINKIPYIVLNKLSTKMLNKDYSHRETNSAEIPSSEEHSISTVPIIVPDAIQQTK